MNVCTAGHECKQMRHTVFKLCFGINLQNDQIVHLKRAHTVDVAINWMKSTVITKDLHSAHADNLQSFETEFAGKVNKIFIIYSMFDMGWNL